MSRIHLRREHDLTPKAARKKVERVAEALASRFDAECTWKGDVLSVNHPSVNGKVTVGRNDWSDAMPPSADALLEYCWLTPMISPFGAFTVK